MDALDRQMRIMFTSPCEAMGAPAGTDTKYIHMRFAMMDRDMTGITIGFFSYLVQLLHYIELNYTVLIDDIEKGTASEGLWSIPRGLNNTDGILAASAQEPSSLPMSAALSSSGMKAASAA